MLSSELLLIVVDAGLSDQKLPFCFMKVCTKSKKRAGWGLAVAMGRSRRWNKQERISFMLPSCMCSIIVKEL